MPSPRSNSTGHRRGQEEKNRRGRLAQKSSSFHGQSPLGTTSQLRRPKTVPDLLPSSRSVVVTTSLLEQQRPMKLTKLLLNVTIQGSLGAVQVVMTPESTVGDLIAAALSQYVKEGRRPILAATEPSRFNLHYSQFSLECLDRELQVMELGSRNFFLCQTTTASGGTDSGGGGDATPITSSSCATQADKAVTKSGFHWLKFMDFML